jgi:hypothetical protein
MRHGPHDRHALPQLSSQPLHAQPYRQEAEVHEAVLPGEEHEWAFLLLLVERPQQLQLHLAVLRRQQPAVLSQRFLRDISDRYNNLQHRSPLS